MKSAYELAMERLAKSDPSAGPLTAEQKAKLAEIDKVYKGKLAERAESQANSKSATKAWWSEAGVGTTCREMQRSGEL
jgi:hypothetical protein